VIALDPARHTPPLLLGMLLLRNRSLLAFITMVHRFVYLASGGAIGGRILWIRILLLLLVGRKTGRSRATPLLYVRDGERWIVAASNAGHDRHPAWWWNLRSRPEARIRVGGQEIDVRWRRADPSERERLWRMLDRAYPSFAAYRSGAKREIPLVIFERAATAP
jgi:deazaflavin-dependent oxidoreductase (nitroreductase family)